MDETKTNLKSSIRQYILDIGGKIVEEPHDPKFDFLFRFEYGDRGFSISKPKKRKELGITHGFHFDGVHLKSLNELMKNAKKFRKFKINFANILHYFRMDFNFNFRENRVVIIKKVFIEKNGISKNLFYERFMDLFSCNKVLLNFIMENLETGELDFKSGTNGTPPSGIYS